MCLTSDSEVRALMLEVQRLGVTLWLDERGAHAEPAERLTPELKGRLRDFKSAVIEYLAEQGESIVDPDAIVLNNTPPRIPEEVEQQRADADRDRVRAQRKYQNGRLLVNDPDAMRFSRYMSELVKLRERSEAISRGDLPPEGRYKTGWDLFNRREYE
jgi:uncharacterized caspase-like protein